MLLAGALSALFMTGFWLYCLTDAIVTAASQCRGLPKPAWIAVIMLTFVGGAVAWLMVRETVRHPSALLTPLPDPGDDSFRAERWTDADDAVARHPADQARAAGALPKGPDDDPEFLRALDRATRGNSQAGGEV